MKKIIPIFILFFSIGLFAQEVDFQLKKDTIKEQTYTGKIGKNPITIHLEYGNLSGGHRGVYSVHGWYHYDKYKKNIPLVGIYDGGFTLYVFNDKKQQQKVIDFYWSPDITSFWDYVDEFKNLEGYKEKLVYDDEIKEWTDGKKKLEFQLNGDYTSILKYEELLLLPNGEQIDLPKTLGDKGFKLINLKTTDSGTDILLNYDYTMRAYALGRCGVGTEAGYWLLKFDKSYQLQEQKRIPLESCEQGFYYEMEDIPDTYVEVYNLMDNYGEIDLPKKVTIDPADIEIYEENE